MNSLGYINGSNVTVKINGSAVGGIISAVCKSKGNLIKIEEFLTDKPVYSQSNPSYLIELKSVTGLSSASKAEEPFSIAFEGGGMRVEYTGCTAVSADERILPDKPAEYSVVINAENRSVEYV